MVNKIESLVDAIGLLNGCPNCPESRAYLLRNPLLIRSYAAAGKHIIDEEGRRVFDSLMAGYRAACFDIQLKIEGKSRAGLKPDDPLTSLLAVYGIKEPGGISTAVSYLRRALKDQSISKLTPLSYFVH